MKNQGKALFAAVALGLATHVSALTTWTWTASPTDTTPNPVAAGGVTATPTGWADTGSGTPRALEQQPGAATNTNFATYSGGLGINNLDGCTSGCGDPGDVYSSAPEHAIDNEQRYEMVLLSFSGAAVNLTSVNFGWIGTDSDYTVMAFQGTAGNQSLAGKTWNTLDSGWKLIGNYSDATLNENRSLNSGGNSSAGVYSSFWLIGAYNPLTGVAQTSGFDYLKLSAVTGCVSGAAGCLQINQQSVPEPGSLALFAIGMLGVIRLRKARQG